MSSQCSFKVEEEDRRIRTRCYSGRKTQRDSTLLALMMEGGGDKPKNVGGLWETGKIKETNSLLVPLERNPALVTYLFQPSETQVGLRSTDCKIINLW